MLRSRRVLNLRAVTSSQLRMGYDVRERVATRIKDRPRDGKFLIDQYRSALHWSTPAVAFMAMCHQYMGGWSEALAYTLLECQSGLTTAEEPAW